LISSVVVQGKPDNLDALIEIIRNSNLCEYHLHDAKGIIIVTLDGNGIEEEISKLREIKAFPHVLSAEVVYSYTEDENQREREKLLKEPGITRVVK